MIRHLLISRISGRWLLWTSF